MSSEAQLSLVHKPTLHGIVAQGAGMIQNLRRSAFAALAVVGVYLLYLVLLAAFMQIELTLVAARKAADYHLISLITFDFAALLVLSGLIPACVLYLLRVRWIGAYMSTGVVSGMLLEYFFLFAFTVGGHRAPFNVAYGTPGDYTGALTTFDLLCEVFRRMPGMGHDIFTYAGHAVAEMSGIGLFFGVLFWLLVVRRSARAM